MRKYIWIKIEEWSRRIILTFGMNGTELLGVLSFSAGLNLLTSDAWKVWPGAFLVVAGTMLFLVAKWMGDLYADATWRHSQYPAGPSISEILKMRFSEYYRFSADKILPLDHKIVIWFLGVSLLFGGVLLYLWKEPNQAPAQTGAETSIRSRPISPPRTKIRLATSKNLWCALTLIALNQKMFEKQGLDVEVTYQLAGVQNMNALVSANVDIANTVEVNSAYQILNGNQDLATIASIVSARDFAVVAKKDSGIVQPKNLVGRTLAFAPGTGAEMFVFALLSQNNITSKSVRLKRIPPAGLVDAIADPSIDAAASWEPFISAMKVRLGPRALVVNTGNPFVGVMNVTVRRSWLAKNRNTAIRFLRALAAAELFMRFRPTDSRRILGTASGLQPELIADIWSKFDFELSLDKEKQIALLQSVINTIVSNEPEYAGRIHPEISGYFDTDELLQMVEGQ